MFYFNKNNFTLDFTFVDPQLIGDFHGQCGIIGVFNLPFSWIPHCSFQKITEIIGNILDCASTIIADKLMIYLSTQVVFKQDYIDRIEIYVKRESANCSIRTFTAKKTYKKYKNTDGTIKINIYTKSKYMYQYIYKIILKKVLTTIGYDRRPLPHTGRVAIYRNPIPYSQILAPNISPYYKHHTRYYGIEGDTKIYVSNHYTKIRIGNVCTKTGVRNDI